jgi:hypothetical protein
MRTRHVQSWYIWMRLVGLKGGSGIAVSAFIRNQFVTES